MSSTVEDRYFVYMYKTKHVCAPIFDDAVWKNKERGRLKNGIYAEWTYANACTYTHVMVVGETSTPVDISPIIHWENQIKRNKHVHQAQITLLPLLLIVIIVLVPLILFNFVKPNAAHSFSLYLNRSVSFHHFQSSIQRISWYIEWTNWWARLIRLSYSLSVSFPLSLSLHAHLSVCMRVCMWAQMLTSGQFDVLNNFLSVRLL